MQLAHTQRKLGSHMIRCQECGQACTQVEFIRGLNLCDHLSLDSLSLKTGREQNNILAALSSIPVF